MSTVIKPVSQMIGADSAANADQLADAIDLSAPEIGIDTVVETSIESIASTGGWDAYEVWRRLIKDARDRRKLPDSN
jgi:hypothetical protein